MHKHSQLETGIGLMLFWSRWLLAPFYIGMTAALVMLLVAFFSELIHIVPDIVRFEYVRSQQIILAVLEMIDLSLVGNLVVIVIFSGYENFVSKIDTRDAEHRPDWMGTLDFSGLKMKLVGSVVAISVIQMLRVFMTLTDGDQAVDVPRLRLMLILHLTFVLSGVLFALMDWIRCHCETPRES
ncbi:MAG TPA: TIGR00645 family protein [Rhizomicrobium sp.]|nr:TIGR00645 family protein [Rhizomicrobium sp.]